VEFTLKYNILLNVNKLIYKLAVKNGLEILHGTPANTSLSHRIGRGYKEDKMSSSWVVHLLNCFLVKFYKDVSHILLRSLLISQSALQ
jgi:hypothetical protein